MELKDKITLQQTYAYNPSQVNPQWNWKEEFLRLNEWCSKEVNPQWNWKLQKNSVQLMLLYQR